MSYQMIEQVNGKALSLTKELKYKYTIYRDKLKNQTN